MNFSDQTNFVAYSILKRVYFLESLTNVNGWSENSFEDLRDGERVELTMKVDSAVVVVIQVGRSGLIEETLKFCMSARSKNMRVKDVRGLVNPVRGSRRQHLPPIDVS